MNISAPEISYILIYVIKKLHFMKKIFYMFIVLAMFNFSANAQWQKINVPHGSDIIAINDMEVPNVNTVWASASVLGGTQWNSANKYLRTADGGATWQYSSVTAQFGYNISNIYALDADTCYASMYDGINGTGGGIFKTTDGGSTWNQLGAGQIFNSASFPDFVYMWDAKDGLAVGDGNGPGTAFFEIYTTNDYGATWVRVPRENLPPTDAQPFGIVNNYTVYGNRIWFDAYESSDGGQNLSAHYVYRSDDKGLHWSAFPVPIATPFRDMTFIDETTGFIVGKYASGDPYLYRSTDGGETWGDPVSYTGNLMGSYISNVPGTNAIVTTNPYLGGPSGSSISYDLGDTWIDISIASGKNFLHSDVKFLNGSVGWSGMALSSGGQSGGIYKWTGNILPVSFTAFTATQTGKSVLLNWETAQELNNSYFAVERSTNGLNFTEIGRVGSKGNSSQPQPYVFEDINYANGHNYYRLRQVDLDGTFNYSSIVSVDALTTQTLKIYPNPVKDLLHVEGLNPDVTTTLSIVNTAGKVLYQFTTTGRSYNYNLQHLPAGTYYLRIMGSDKKTNTLKFVKQPVYLSNTL